MELLKIDDMQISNIDFYHAYKLNDMQVLDFRKREFKSIPELILPRSVPSTEAKIYVYEDKNKWQKYLNAIKIFYNPEKMPDKSYTIGELIRNKDIIGLDELVMPLALVSVDKELRGYMMPYIESSLNMKVFLNNPNVSLKDKLKYLKEILVLLNKIESVHALEGNFFLGDIHEANFIFDAESQRIKVVDMDSAVINGSDIPVSKFMTYNFNLYNFPNKYPMNDEDRHIPSHNTQMLSFIYMLLNAISLDKSYRWSVEDYYFYLNYLERLGISHNVTDALSHAYDSSPRVDFNVELLSEIDPNKDYRLQLSK